jgi:hypothetical protein
MRNRIRFAITLAGVVLSALPNLAMAQSGPGDPQGGQAASIEGTWILNVQVAPGVSFWALQSFTAGGVTVATGSNDRIPSPTSPYGVMSPLYGSWTRIDDNHYTLTICFFFFDTTGAPRGMFKTNETLRLTGNNSLEGQGVGFSCYISGTQCGGPFPPITITGTRLIPQAP